MSIYTTSRLSRADHKYIPRIVHSEMTLLVTYAFPVKSLIIFQLEHEPG